MSIALEAQSAIYTEPILNQDRDWYTVPYVTYEYVIILVDIYACIVQSLVSFIMVYNKNMV